MPDAAAIVAEARSWIGTPFHPQASVKGRGCDCKGLIVGVARELGIPAADSIYAAMQPDHLFRFDAKMLKRGLADTMDAVADPRPGDVLLLKVGGKSQHLAILTAPDRMVHTYGKGPEKVIEVPLGHVWRAAVDSAWRFRGLT